MTLDEKIAEAASRAYCKVIGLSYDGLSPVLAAKRDEAICAAITAYQAEAWQPIETAPKDGTAILVHEPGKYGPWIDVARWHEYWDTRKGASVEGWFDNGLEQRTCDRPTHWQPLPPPPVGSGRSLADANSKSPIQAREE